MPKNGDLGAGIIPSVIGLLALVTGVTIYQQSTSAIRSAQPAAVEEATKPSVSTRTSSPAAEILAAFLNRDFDQSSVDDLFSVAKASGVSKMSFLIATIPDYVDSSSYWVADQTIDTIQRGAGALGYQLDRFKLPDSEISVNPGQSAPIPRLHETQPGIILFRRIVNPPNPRIELLAVFLIGETPTAGIHQKAFLAAAGTICEWSRAAKTNAIAGAGADGTLLVLGPTFSGSALSLRSAIKAFTQKGAACAPGRVRIVSGTATNPDNLPLLTFDNTSFAATVHTDDDLLAALYRYLVRLNPGWANEGRVALISESNTVYGLGFQNSGESTPSQNSSKPFDKAIRMSFPIHISRLRGAAGSAGSRQGTASALQPQSIGLNMEERSAAADRIPSFAPDMTSAIVELTLANMLDMIRREHIAAVGIFATDKRDHLFLSREILRRAPNVLLFATESDLLLIHPDYGSFVKGTIVASSYPLFSGTQPLTDNEQATKVRMQFPTMGAQGTYNAMLALLEPSCLNPESGRPSQGEPSPRPLDYAFFRSKDDGREAGPPPVWINVAGRDAFWPITMENPKDESTSYTLPAPARASARETDWIKLPTLAIFLCLIITLAFAGHVIAYLLTIPKLPKDPEASRNSVARIFRRLQARLQTWADDELPLARWFDSRHEVEEKSLEEPVRTERRRFLLICCTILGLITFWVWRLLIIWKWGAVRHTPQGKVWGAILLLFILAVIVGFALTLYDRASLWRRFRGQSASRTDSGPDPARRSVRHFYVATMTAFLMVVPAFAAAMALWQVLVGTAEFPPVYDKLLLARTLSAANGVSQASLVLLLAAAIYLWAFWTVGQLSMRGDYYDTNCGLFRLLGGEPASAPQPDAAAEDPGGSEPLRLELAAILASPWRRTRPWLLVGVLLAVLTYGLFTWGNGYGVDGFYFSRFIWWVTLLAVFVFAHSVSQTIHLAMLLGRTLRDLGTHPLAPAFKRIAERSLFDWRLSARPSRARQLRPVLNLAQTLMTLCPEPDDASLEIAADSIRKQPDVAFLRSKAWGILVAVGTRVQEVLELGPWRKAEQDKGSKWNETGENLLAMLVSFVIRDLLSRLVTGFSVALAMAVLICGAHMFYPFQGRHLFVWMDLSVIAILVLMGAGVLLHFERDTVLSHSLSGTPGRINLTGKLVYRVVIGVAVSLLTILAARFPELGTNLTAWIEPFRNLP